MKIEAFGLQMEIKRVVPTKNSNVSVPCFGCGKGYITQVHKLRTSNYCDKCSPRLI